MAARKPRRKPDNRRRDDRRWLIGTMIAILAVLVPFLTWAFTKDDPAATVVVTPPMVETAGSDEARNEIASPELHEVPYVRPAERQKPVTYTKAEPIEESPTEIAAVDDIVRVDGNTTEVRGFSFGKALASSSPARLRVGAVRGRDPTDVAADNIVTPEP